MMRRQLTYAVFVGLMGMALTSVVLIESSVVAKPLRSHPDNIEVAVPSPQVTSGQKTKIEGVIVQSDSNRFLVRNQRGSEFMVLLQNTTKVEEKKSNPFRGAKQYSRDDLIRGLIVEVEGRGDDTGALIAEEIRFRDDDLMIARTIKSQVTPIEQRLSETEGRLNDTEQNAQHLSGQVGELVAVTKRVRNEAQTAQETAEAAVIGVRRTNDRISALDDYAIQNDLTINFKVGSAALSPEARASLDEIATEAKVQRGFVIEVAGFASADGNEAFNRRLSQRRAEMVVRYLVDQHDIPLRRILTPYGYGELHPVAENSSLQGRRENRRVEVRVLVNRGLTTPVDLNQLSNETGRNQQPAQTH